MRVHRLGPKLDRRDRRWLERDGHCFLEVFGEEGDWASSTRMGARLLHSRMATREHHAGLGSSRAYRIGAAYGNQDVCLLERRGRNRTSM